MTGKRGDDGRFRGRKPDSLSEGGQMSEWAFDGPGNVGCGNVCGVSDPKPNYCQKDFPG